MTGKDKLITIEDGLHLEAPLDRKDATAHRGTKETDIIVTDHQLDTDAVVHHVPGMIDPVLHVGTTDPVLRATATKDLVHQEEVLPEETTATTDQDTIDVTPEVAQDPTVATLNDERVWTS